MVDERVEAFGDALVLGARVEVKCCGSFDYQRCDACLNEREAAVLAETGEYRGWTYEQDGDQLRPFCEICSKERDGDE